MQAAAIYPGSFDPATNGHLDIIERCRALFDRVVVAVLSNPRKDAMFSLESRVEMMRELLRGNEGVEIVSFEGLLVRVAREREAAVIVRGLRAVSDFEYEFQMAMMNRQLDDEIETMFMVPREDYTYLSSSLIKEVYGLGGSVSGLVPPLVEERLREHFDAQ